MHASRKLRAIAATALPGLALWLSASAVAADTPPICDPADHTQVRLRVNVSGMRSDKGNITITIYPDDADHFLDGTYKLARQELPVTLPVTTACFVMPAPGYYAVALFHDANNNHHFDTTWLGLPDEGYGFSRNPTLRFGPPDLEDVRIPAKPGDNPVSVQMKRY